MFLEHTLVVLADLCGSRTLIHPGVLTGLIDRVASQRAGIHAVVRRRLMQAHERIRVVPVTARAMAPVHHHHLGIAISDKRIGKRHPRGASTDHEIVGLDHRRPPLFDRCYACRGPDAWTVRDATAPRRRDDAGRAVHSSGESPRVVRGGTGRAQLVDRPSRADRCRAPLHNPGARLVRFGRLARVARATLFVCGTSDARHRSRTPETLALQGSCHLRPFLDQPAISAESQRNCSNTA
jgi:hypothetical protein